VQAIVQSRFSDDVGAELPGYIAAADPDTVVLRRGAAPGADLSSGGKAQLVMLVKPPPEAPTAAVARVARGADTEAAIQVAAQLAVADGLDLVLTPPGRTTSNRVADLTKRGLEATAGLQPASSVIVAPDSDSAGEGNGGPDSDVKINGEAVRDDGDIHIAVVAGSNEASDDMDQWVEALDGHKQRESRQQ
jgi:hypothetical protein